MSVAFEGQFTVTTDEDAEYPAAQITKQLGFVAERSIIPSVHALEPVVYAIPVDSSNPEHVIC